MTLELELMSDNGVGEFSFSDQIFHPLHLVFLCPSFLHLPQPLN